MAKTDFFVFLALFGAYIGQPDSHIGWVTLMPFASINSTNPRTNLWNFGDNCSAFGGSWKTQFFWVGHFEFFFSKKKKIFCFILIQISHNLWDTKNFFEILMITLISSKNLGGIEIWTTLYNHKKHFWILVAFNMNLCAHL